MKVIDLLKKIANGEIEYEQKIKIDNEIITVSHLLGAYIFNKERFNDEVEIIEEEKKAPILNDIRESYGLPRIEEKKIPEKLGKIDDNDGYIDQNDVIKIGKKVDEIIDCLKSKGA